jgi:iron complex outermembrane recepter protein
MPRLCQFAGATLLLLANTTSGYGQQETGVIQGVIRDETGGPLAAVQVYVRTARREIQTDARGQFRIALPAGRHVLQVSVVGYASERREVDVLADGVVQFALDLRVSPLSLPGVQVTASAGAGDALAVTQATTQLSGKQLERELSSTVAQTLRSQPGLAVRFMGPAAAMPVMRGLTGDRILVLQDGLRAGDLSGSADDHGVTIDPLTAQRIEVVRGPATLLYGNNALGGVVNVISTSIPDHVPPRAEWSGAAHSESAFPGAAAGIKTSFALSSRWAASVSAGARTSADMRIPNDPVLGNRLMNSDMRNWNASAAVGYVAAGISAGGVVKGYDFTYGLPVPPGAAAVSLRGRRYEATARGEARFESARIASIKLDATYQNYRHDEMDDASRSVLQSFALNTQTFNVLLRHQEIGRVTEGAVGISGLFKDYDATGYHALTPAAVSRGFGVFTFQELRLLEGGAALQIGARADHYAIASRRSEKFGPSRVRSFPSLSGSLGVRVPISPIASGSFSVARSFRAPTVEEMFSNAAHAGTGAVELGNADLRAEHGVAIEGVLRVQSERWNGQLAAYRNTVDDYVLLQARGDTAIGGVTLPVLSYAQAPAVLQGVEGSIEWAASNMVMLSVIGDYLHAAQDNGVPLSFMPPARIGVLGRWDDGRYSIGADVHHEFRQDRVGAADELPTPSHAILRMHAGMRFRAAKRHHSVTLRLENLTNELHREATSRIKDFAPGPGRNIALAYKVLF